MIVNKILISITTALVASLFVGGIYYQTSPMMWFADISILSMFVRGVILILLLALLLTNSPRSVAFRSILGIGALGMVGVAIYQFSAYSIHFLDMIVFVQVGILLAIEALEFRRDAMTHPDAQTHKIPVTAVSL